MAELLRSFEGTFRGGGTAFAARVVGRLASDGMWEAWLEFVPEDGSSSVLATPVESRQPARTHLDYWASGLSAVYVEGALERGRNPATVTVRVEEPPHTSAPAPRPINVEASPPPVEPVLDPFEVGERSLDILRQELAALNRPRLVNIITAFDLNASGEDIGWMTDAQLVTFIATAVEAILAQGR